MSVMSVISYPHPHEPALWKDSPDSNKGTRVWMRIENHRHHRHDPRHDHRAGATEGWRWSKTDARDTLLCRLGQRSRRISWRIGRAGLAVNGPARGSAEWRSSGVLCHIRHAQVAEVSQSHVAAIYGRVTLRVDHLYTGLGPAAPCAANVLILLERGQTEHILLASSGLAGSVWLCHGVNRGAGVNMHPETWKALCPVIGSEA